MDISATINISKALLTPVIGLLGVYIAYQQWLTNEQKRRQELFDKRWEFYTELKNSFETLVRNEYYFDETDFFIENNTYDKAKYLFGEDIAEHILQMGKNSGGYNYDWFSRPFDKYLFVERPSICFKTIKQKLGFGAKP